jgi:hypothetical protein
MGQPRTMLTKDQRITQIINAKNNFYLGLAALALFQQEENYQALNSMSIQISGKYGFEFKQVVTLLNHKELGDDARKEFSMMLLRTLLKEPFEMVRTYAKEHSLSIRKQPWFQVARILRNTVSHDFRFDLNDRESQKVLPVEWNGLQITAEIHGEYLSLEHCPLAFARELVNEFQGFIKNY